MLMGALAERKPEREPAAIILVSAPFVGEGGWPGDGFEPPRDLGDRPSRGVQVQIYHGLDDDTAPPAHADLYARAIPQAKCTSCPAATTSLGMILGWWRRWFAV